MASFARERVVDLAGGGTDVSITAGIAAAVSAGAAWATPWRVFVGPGLFTENITIPIGVTVEGCGPLTRILGTVDMQAGSALRGVFVDMRSNPSGYSYALGLRFDGTENFYAENCIFYVFKDVNAVVNAVEATDDGTAIARVLNCFIYAANRITTAAPLAKVVAVRLGTDFESAVEIFGGHVKTSAGQNGVSESVCVLNQQVGGAGVPFGYARIHSGWMAGYAGLSPTPPAVMLDSANTTHPGAELDVGWWNPAGSIPIVRSAYTGVPTSVNVGPLTHSHFNYNTGTQGEFTQFYEDGPFPVPAGIILDHTPTGADAAPPRTVAYVLP